MDMHADLPRAPLPAPRPLPRAAAPAATPPAHACATCSVRHLCLPAGLDEGGLRALDALRIGRKRLRKGQKVYREGDAFHFLYAARFGTFKTSFTLESGGEHVASFHLAGDVMGFDGAADGTHPTTATALENAEVCAIPYAQLVDACATSAPLRKRMSQLMGERIVREYRSSILLARRHSEERVAGFLLQVGDWMGARGYSPREFHLRMSRAEIGSYLGTTHETVSRCLSQFARQGFITVRSRRIELVRAEGLRKAGVA